VRVVLDTNVFLSGLMLPDSIPGRMIKAWHAAQFDLVLSEPMLVEFQRVLGYPKIKARLRWDENTIQRFILLLRFKAEVVEITGIKVEVPADSDDTPVLRALVAGRAECLVTGDNDLLALREHYPILTPAEFVKRL